MQASTTVRIRPETREKLKELARRAGVPMPTLLDEMVEAYRRQRLLEEANRAFAELRADEKAWQQEQAERADWDAALGDGLEGD